MISVILANYNGEKFLAEAIESVLAQDYDDYEFIVVDDGSTDDSRQIISALSSQYPDQIKPVFAEENRGQGVAFNMGIERANGDIFTFIDSDDVWFPEKLAGVQHNLQQQPRAVLFQHNLAIMRDSEITDERFRDILTVGDYFKYTRRKQVIPQFIPTSGLAFRRDALAHVIPIPDQFRTCADGFLTRTTFCFGEVFSVNECWGAYRVHSDNNTFDNPAFSNNRYLSRLLIPALNEFYASHRIDLHFHDRLAQLKETVTALPLSSQGRLLLLRSANPDTMQDIIESLLTIWPELNIDLLIQPSVMSHFNDSRLRLLPIQEGFFNSETVSGDVLQQIQSEDYALGLVPYSINNPYAYHNIHILLGTLNRCPFVGVDYDGHAHAIDTSRLTPHQR